MRLSGCVKKGLMAALTMAVTGNLCAGVLFEADFSSLEKAEAQWENLNNIIRRNDAKCYDGGLEIMSAGAEEKGYAIIPRATLPPVFSVEFSCASLERSGKDNHFSVSVDGILVVIRRWGLVCIRGKESQTGKFSGIGNNKEHTFLIESLPEKVRVYANGNLACEMDKAPDAAPRLRLNYYNTNVLLKNFKIFEGERGKEAISANILRNSSFETVNNNLPDYWGTVHWGITGAPWHVRMDEFRRHWRIDHGVAFEGKNSFRIEGTADHKENYYLGLYSCWPPLNKGEKYTFSVYLKGDGDSLPVMIGPRNNKDAQQTVKVGREWQRYNTTFVHGGGGEQLTIRPMGKGIIWIDAAQLESGDHAGAYVCHSSERGIVDTIKTPELRIPFTGSPPVLDGGLDDPAWKLAYRGSMVNAKDGSMPGDRTDFYLVRDENQLYVGLECFEQRMDALIANVTKDKGPIWNDDSVELFFKPEEKGNSYYQFAVNSLNFGYEGRAFADVNWNAPWEHKVKRGTRSWTVNIAIPFATLCMEPDKDALKFNVCRSNKKTNEISAWAKTGSSFLNHNSWGLLHTGKTVGGVFVDKACFIKSQARAGISKLSLELMNNSGKDIDGTLEMLIAGGISQQRQVKVKDNSGIRVCFDNLALPDGESFRVMLNCRNSTGQPLMSRTEILSTPGVLEATREFSYFSGEREKRFRVKINGAFEKESRIVCRLTQGGTRLWNSSIAANGTHDIIVIPNTFGIGEFRVEVELLDREGKVISGTHDDYRVLVPQQHEGKINYWRRSILLSGKEVYLWGNYLEAWPSKEMIDILADNGFNNITLMIREAPSAEKSRAMLDYAASRNVNIAAWFGNLHKGGIDNAIKAAPAFVNHPALLAFYPFDETKSHNYPASMLDAEAARLRAVIGGNTLILHNENDYGVMQNTNFKHADIISLDHYTIPEREIESISVILDRLKQHAGNRPCCFVAQSTGNAYSYGREPTPAELENQSYQAFVGDVWNVMFFANIPLGQDNFPTLKRLSGEHATLVTMGVPSADNVDISCISRDVKFICRDLGDTRVLVAVNLGNRNIRVEFAADWIKAGDSADVLFESRKVTSKSGGFTDEFKALGRHVYVLKK